MRAPRVLEDLGRWALYELTTAAHRVELVALIRRTGSATLSTRGRRQALRLRVVGTEQPRGGLRLWWECPSCRGIAAVLFGDPGAIALPCCKRCVGLPYRSQRDAGAKAWELVGKPARIAERCHKRRTQHQDGSPRRAKRSKRQSELRERELAARRLACSGLELLRPASLTRSPQATRAYAIAEQAVKRMRQTIHSPKPPR